MNSEHVIHRWCIYADDYDRRQYVDRLTPDAARVEGARRFLVRPEDVVVRYVKTIRTVVKGVVAA